MKRQAKSITVQRVQRKRKLTAVEQARIDALRDKYQRDKPGPDQLVAGGTHDGPVQAGTFWALSGLVARFQAERERQGLTLAQLAERAGIDKGAISKLESGRQINPTLDTLSRIAVGLGMRLELMLQTDEKNGIPTRPARRARSS